MGWRIVRCRSVRPAQGADETVRCARCGELIGAAEAFDLGHVDGSRNLYAGAEHRKCVGRRGPARPRSWLAAPVR